MPSDHGQADVCAGMGVLLEEVVLATVASDERGLVGRAADLAGYGATAAVRTNNTAA